MRGSVHERGLYCVKGLGHQTKSSASKYTDFPVFLRKSHSIYGKETEHKSAQEGIIYDKLAVYTDIE